MKKIVVLALICFGFSTVFAQEKNNSDIFWSELKKHCGKAYEGTILKGGKEGDGFTGERLLMYVNICKDNEIYIPFNVGNNRSRTWILKKNSEGFIQLKHDHRMENGQPDKVTMYGGTTTNKGTKQMQIFPADEETKQLIAYASSNVWWITIDENTFTYNLLRVGTDRVFTVSFDLTKEVKVPEKSWGW